MSDNYDDLYELLLKFTDDNIKEVVHWVIHHKNIIKSNNIATDNIKIEEPLKSYLFQLKKMAGSAALEMHGEYLQEINNLYSSKIRHLLTKTDKLFLDYAISIQNMEALQNNISTIFQNNDNSSQKPECLPIFHSTDSYEQEKEAYLKDTALLISDIIIILREEYQKRILETKVAILKYTEPHRNALSSLTNDLASVDLAIAKLNKDTMLSENDKQQFLEALSDKKKEMILIKHREEESIKDTKAFIQEIKSAQERFNKMIHLLEKKNLEATTRKEYLRLIEKLDAQIPALDNLFHDLAVEFKNDIVNIKSAFYLLNMSIKDDLYKSLEDQQRIGEILGVSGKTVLNQIKTNRDVLEKITGDDTVYDIDLSFLDIVPSKEEQL